MDNLTTVDYCQIEIGKQKWAWVKKGDFSDGPYDLIQGIITGARIVTYVEKDTTSQEIYWVINFLVGMIGYNVVVTDSHTFETREAALAWRDEQKSLFFFEVE